jgi:F-type H+-transporting ATPase subunit gamma
MIETKDTIKKKINTAVKLQTIIKSMKMMSFVQINQYNKASEGMNFYAKNIIDGLRIYLINKGFQSKDTIPNNKKKSLYKFIGTDQGLVGNFNQLVINEEKKINPEQRANARYLIYGKSLYARFTEKDKVVDFYKMPTNIKSVVKVAEDIVLRLRDEYEKGVENVYLVYNKKKDNVMLETITEKVFPLDEEFLSRISKKKWKRGQIPMIVGNKKDNYKALVRQYIFVEIYKILINSLLAEHFNRTMLLDRSEKNVKEQIEQMSKVQQEKRQEEITNELLDIVAGRLGDE